MQEKNWKNRKKKVRKKNAVKKFEVNNLIYF